MSAQPAEHTFSFVEKKLPASKSQRVVPETSRPLGYGEHTTVAYYNKECAEAVKKKLDALDSVSKDTIIYFPVPKYKTDRTVYEQVYYGFRYLVERLDPDGKYAALRKQLALKKERNRVKVYWKAGNLSTLEGGEIVHLGGYTEDGEAVADTRVLSWQDKITKWAIEGEDPSVEEARIVLEEDEMNWIREYLIGFSANIVIVRLNPGGYKLIKNHKMVEAMKR